MTATNFDLTLLSQSVSGVGAVPTDVQYVTVKLVFDATTPNGTRDATDGVHHRPGRWRADLRSQAYDHCFMVQGHADRDQLPGYRQLDDAHRRERHLPRTPEARQLGGCVGLRLQTSPNDRVNGGDAVHLRVRERS